MSRKLRMPGTGKPVPGLTMLKRLSADRRAEIFEWLGAMSLSDGAKKIGEELGIKVGRTALSAFYSWQGHQQRLENYNHLIERFEEFYTKQNPNASRDKVREAGIAFFLAETAANQDRQGFVDVANLDLREREGKTKAAFEERKITVSEKKVAMLEDKIASAQRAIDQARSSKGGITEETLSKIERELKLL